MSAGGTAWSKSAPQDALQAKGQAWLREYMSSTLPSVPIEALGESCFAPSTGAAPAAPTSGDPRADSFTAPPADADAAEASADSTALPPARRKLELNSLFNNIYLGEANGASVARTSTPTPLLKLPEGSGKLPPRPPSMPGSERLVAGGKRGSGEKALQRVTLSDRASTSGSFHSDRGADPGSKISLTARNLVLKEKMEKKEKEKKESARSAMAMASRPESTVMAGLDEEELEALAGADLSHACASPARVGTILSRALLAGKYAQARMHAAHAWVTCVHACRGAGRRGAGAAGA